MITSTDKIKYLVDTNVLIEFSLWKSMSLNLNNEFWSKLSDALKIGNWVLLDVVVKEVLYDNDLITWFKELNKKGLITKLKDENRERAVEINNLYKMIDETNGKSEVDTFLIAYAEANNLGIFSRESPRKSTDDLYKIPDVCQILNIKRVSKPRVFLKEIGFN